MGLIGKTTRRPITVLIISILVVGFGAVMVPRLAINLMPDVEFSQVYISASYAGATPEVVEEKVTKPIESAIRSIDNIEKVTSTSSEGNSRISVEFKYKTGFDKNVSNVRAALNMVRAALPENVSPVLYQFSAASAPVLVMSISAGRSQNEVSEYVDRVLKPYFEQISGVARVEVSGGSAKRVYVNVALNRLNAFNLTLGEVANSIKSNGTRTGIGSISTKYQDVGLVVDGKYKSIDEIRNTVVSTRVENGERVSVRVRDVAEVRFDYDDGSGQKRIELVNDKPMVAVKFYKQNKDSVVTIANNIQQELVKIQSIAPKDFEFVTLWDGSDFIRKTINNVTRSALLGGFLAIVVLSLFLRNPATVFVVGLSMPISIIITLMVMYFAGFTLNMMTLSGLALGVGMLVDNSIVVIENIYEKRMKGVRLLPAAQYGTSEMATPVLASTLTTVFVFLPIVIFERDLGVVGAYFAQLGLAIVVSILASYVTAMLLVPVLASRFIPVHQMHYRGVFAKIDTSIGNGIKGMGAIHQNVLRYMLPRKKRFALLIIVLSMLPFLLVLKMGFTFIPEFSESDFLVRFKFPSGKKTDDMLATVHDLQEKIGDKMLPYRDVGISVGSNSARLTYYFSEDVSPDAFRELGDNLTKKYANNYPGVDLSFGSRHSGGGGGSKGFSLEVKSADYDTLQRTVERFKNTLKTKLPKLYNVDSNQRGNIPAFSMNVNRALAASSGISIDTIAKELSYVIGSKKVSTYTEGARDYDITLQLRNEDRNRINFFDQLSIKSTDGAVPFVNLVNRELSTSLNEVQRSEFQRTITITARQMKGYAANQAVADAKAALATLPVDEDVTYFFTGEFEDINKNSRTMLLIFIVAASFVFGILASQFESLRDPFIVMFTVPLMFSGVLILYFLMGKSISAFTLVGVVMLVGIAVNHGIVMVDYINVLRKRGVEFEEAIITGAESRLRPILMTSFTTIFGMMPLAFATSSGSEMLSPIALTVVGGLSASALLSLLMLPLVYYMFHIGQIKRIEKKRLKLEKKNAHRIAVPIRGV